MENHHYVPESRGGTLKDTVRICGTCHDVIHYYIDIDDIERHKTIEELLQHNDISNYVKWVETKKNTGHWKIKKILHVIAS
jgi:hypothetical protein